MKCPKCKKAGAYIRKWREEIYCRLCGETTPLKEKSTEKK